MDVKAFIFLEKIVTEWREIVWLIFKSDFPFSRKNDLQKKSPDNIFYQKRNEIECNIKVLLLRTVIWSKYGSRNAIMRIKWDKGITSKTSTRHFNFDQGEFDFDNVF